MHLVLAVAAVGALASAAALRARSAPPQRLDWALEDGVAACGLDPADAAPGDRTLRHVHLTLRANGRVVFAQPAAEVYCHRPDRRPHPDALAGEDFIQVDVPASSSESTAAHWRSLYRGFGAGPAAMAQLAAWSETTRRMHAAGETVMAVWRPRDRRVAVHAEHPPLNSEPPVTYGSHVTLRWDSPSPR